MVKVFVVGFTMLAIVVISVVALIVSTSQGSTFSESVWKSLDNKPDGPSSEDHGED